MSDVLFPTLPGLAWEFKRVPMFKTTIKEAVSGREYRNRRMTSPRYTYKATFEFLRDRRQGNDELRTMLGFFNARSGAFDSWLFNDPDDNTATSQPFGVGDGATTDFQLVRTLGGATEPVYYAPTFALFVNSTGVSGSDLGNGMVRFAAPPAAGATLAWNGTYYWRCRFLQDQLEFGKFAWRLWHLKTCDFITLKPPF